MAGPDVADWLLLEIHPMYGSHLSIAGGMHLAIGKARELGMTTVQVFTYIWTLSQCKRYNAPNEENH